MTNEVDVLKQMAEAKYPYGFRSNFDAEVAPKGLDESTIRFIAEKKQEPSWLLERRLQAYRHFLSLKPPKWAKLRYPAIDYQSLSYYAAPKQNLAEGSELNPELSTTLVNLGLSLQEKQQMTGVAMDLVLDSVSIATTYKDQLKELGILFCSFSEAVKNYPSLVKKYLDGVVPITDNYFAALNAAVFSDGAFCYIPAGVRCPVSLSSYFRINTAGVGQFERTLIIAEENAYVSYLEGCTASMSSVNQLHAAVVEIYAAREAEVRYATIQNWYPGNQEGQGGIYNFVTKRGLCAGNRAKISWTQVETGSAITWKYPSCILQGEGSVGEFYSVAFTKNHQQADTGTKMIHLGKGTKSRIVSKGISAGKSQNSYRGLVKICQQATQSRNFSQCDSLLLGQDCGAHTFPYITVANASSSVEHEATTSKIGEEQQFYCEQRGISKEKSAALILTGYCKEVLEKLPIGYMVEVRKLLSLPLEGSIG